MLGYHNQEQLSAASGVTRRTIGPLIAGTFESQPSVKTLHGLDLALGCPQGTLVRAFQLGDVTLIEQQPLAGTDDPAAWVLQRLGTRGATTDPDWMLDMARRLERSLPGVAQVLEVIAQVAAEGSGAGAALTELAVVSRDRGEFAVRTGRRHQPAALQLPLMAEVAG